MLNSSNICYTNYLRSCLISDWQTMTDHRKPTKDDVKVKATVRNMIKQNRCQHQHQFCLDNWHYGDCTTSSTWTDHQQQFLGMTRWRLLTFTLLSTGSPNTPTKPTSTPGTWLVICVSCWETCVACFFNRWQFYKQLFERNYGLQFIKHMFNICQTSVKHMWNIC